MGVGVKCDRVGVLGQPYVVALCLKFQNANPRIYPWEATSPPQPTNLFVGKFVGKIVASK